jgi:hypothetical protein
MCVYTPPPKFHSCTALERSWWHQRTASFEHLLTIVACEASNESAPRILKSLVENLQGRLHANATNNCNLPCQLSISSPSSASFPWQSKLVAFQSALIKPRQMASKATIHAPLTKRDEIRLLILHPGLTASPVKCTLIHAYLNSNPAYDALSYVWGSMTDTNTISINESPHLIGKNLFLALKHLRFKNKDRILWVDALCINQANDGERGHQVAQMGVLYSRAKTVRIWLGQSDSFIAAAFSRLDKLRNCLDPSLYSPEASSVGFRKLCNREYWNRLWVIQEVVLASKIEIHCGTHVLPWEIFARVVLESVSQTGQVEQKNIGELAVAKLCRRKAALEHWKVGLELRMVQALSPPASLLFLGDMHAQAKCSDARDKVYGLQSLAPQCCQKAIAIDYTCSAFELCRRLLHHEIWQHWGATSAGKGLLQASSRLHRLLLQGASNQRSINTIFEAGSLSKTAFEAYSSQSSPILSVEVFEFGSVRWISRSLRQLLEDGQDLEFPVDLLDHLHRRNTASLSLTSHSILWPSILPTLETVDYVEMKRILDPEFIDPSCSPSPIYEGANRTIQLVVDGSQGESREDPWYRGRTSAVLRDLLSSVTDYLRGQRLILWLGTSFANSLTQRSLV